MQGAGGLSPSRMLKSNNKVISNGVKMQFHQFLEPEHGQHFCGKLLDRVRAQAEQPNQSATFPLVLKMCFLF